MSTFEKEAVVVGGNKIRDLLFDEQLPYATHKCFPSPSLVLELHEKNQVEAAGVSPAPEAAPSLRDRAGIWLGHNHLFWGLLAILTVLNMGPVWDAEILPGADLHAHPASHLSFGADENGDGGIFWGKPGLQLADGTDNVRAELQPCAPDKHSGFDEDFIRDATRTLLISYLRRNTSRRLLCNVRYSGSCLVVFSRA